MGFDGRDRVRDDLAREMIVGTPDSSIPNQKVDTGSEAQAFAAVIRKHTLEATRRSDVLADVPLPRRQWQADLRRGQGCRGPEDRPAGRERPRNMWVTSTAPSTALTAYFAESGFQVLTVRLLVPRTATEKVSVGTAVPAAS